LDPPDDVGEVALGAIDQEAQSKSNAGLPEGGVTVTQQDLQGAGASKDN
jgi:hypothetical protein